MLSVLLCKTFNNSSVTMRPTTQVSGIGSLNIIFAFVNSVEYPDEMPHYAASS